MKASQFCYWLQGYFELSKAEKIDEKTTEEIKKHLKMVFKYELDKEHGDEEMQSQLNEIHNRIMDY